jgi:hypothetical protein
MKKLTALVGPIACADKVRADKTADKSWAPTNLGREGGAAV